MTRNEFEKCKLFREEWRVIQVVFSNSAFIDEIITNDHVLAVYEISNEVIVDLAPADSAGFKWTEAAQFKPPADAWRPFVIAPDPTFSARGFGG
ncbi:hypothetical protein FHS52_003137 [Erythromicrobium ramosum]|uniref:DUF2442 domain-containing protein n=1 Tax=Erythrobacter ramosus TaxID=35811 RepID=A0ABR6I2K4_9SPHN|nr:hypothetical protein [Erythrobacter ramosus]